MPRLNFTMWDLMRHRDRFEAQVRNVGVPGVCWNWLGGMSSTGTGNFLITTADNKRAQASPHRLALFFFADEEYPSPRVDVLHTCGNRRCCNPEHLEKVRIGKNSNPRPKGG